MSTQATAKKNGFSCGSGTTVAIFTSSSPTASRNLSAVAGESSTSGSVTPFCSRALSSASRSAKSTVDPRNSGGSPIPLLLWIERMLFHDTPFRKLTLNSCGMSLKPGIL